MEPNETAPATERKAADVLMLKELPVLAGVVTVVAQPFAQIRLHYQDVLPDWLPLAVAAVVSLLLAVYFVRTVRRTRHEDAVFMIPLLMLMVFSASIGANNLVDSAASGGARSADALRQAEAGAERLRAQLGNAERQLAIERERGRLMRRALGLPEDETPVAEEAKKLSQGGAAWLGFLVGAAHAQEAAPKPAAKPAAKSATKALPLADEELRRKIAEFDRQQQALKEQEQKLRQGETATAAGRGARPLWKSW